MLIGSLQILGFSARQIASIDRSRIPRSHGFIQPIMVELYLPGSS